MDSSANALDFMSKMGNVGRVGSPDFVGVGTAGLRGVVGALTDVVVVLVVVELLDELLVLPAVALVFLFRYSSNETFKNKEINITAIFYH